MQQIAIDDIALGNARIATEAAEALAAYMRSLPEDGWNGPTACTKWTVHDLAVHITSLYCIFASLAEEVVATDALVDRGLEIMEPLEHGRKVGAYARHHGIDVMDGNALADVILDGAARYEGAIRRADGAALQQPVTVPFGQFPLFLTANMLAIDGALHYWDVRVRREPGVTVAPDWAVPLAMSVPSWVPYLAHPEGRASVTGTFLLDVDGLGPVTIEARDGSVAAEMGRISPPDVTLHLTPDEFLRLAFGRLDLSTATGVTIDRERANVAQLNEIFRGI